MEIRKSTYKDLEEILKIYEYARDFMKKHNNPHQWGTLWPPKSLIEEDIKLEKSYVCIHQNQIVGTFFYDYGKDIEPTYLRISKGKWLEDTAYGIIHRIASNGKISGVGKFCLDWAFNLSKHLRVDTHEDNLIMQNLLKKCGFVYCGIIHLNTDHTSRLAYEKMEVL